MQTRNQVQVPLALAVPTELVLVKAAELFGRSRLLRKKYASLERLLEDPVAGRCLRLCATQLLRSQGSRTRGR